MSQTKEQRRELNVGYQRARCKRNRKLIDSLKDVPCADCSAKYPPYVMHFDHLDPTLKKFNIGKSVSNSAESILEEIAKCDVVCANCHAIRTHKRRLLV